MIGRIAYRGPDANGICVHRDTGLAHARLSVIDPQAGSNQPMEAFDGEVAIVFNGEIYNYAQLRDDLITEGHQFVTRSDTEVLLHLYRRDGTAMFDQLNGMFAFAIHDRRTGELILARDRMGKKPLYYAERPDSFAFGSELKAVLAHPSVDFELNHIAVGQYLAFDYVPTPLTILAGVRRLRPGHVLIARSGRVIAERAYWSLDFRTRQIDHHVAIARFDEALATATRARLVADVPLGVFLSGGIDSSAVAWYAQEASSRPISTFSVGFREASYDESQHARRVAEHLGTYHHEEVLSQRESLELIPTLGSLVDEPFADPSLVATYLLSSFARTHVTVCLGGDGSDELLGGYPTFVADRLRGIGSIVPKRLLQRMRRLTRRLPTSEANMALDFRARQFLGGLEGDPRHAQTLWLSSFPPHARSRVLSAELRRELEGTTGLEPVDELYAGEEASTIEDRFDEVSLGYLRTYLLDDILFKVDRASMYNSLEVRAPFLDVGVVELVASLPAREKLRRLRGKRLLREVMRDRLPDEILDRPKKGFGIPLAGWLRRELRPLCEDLLLSAEFRSSGLFDAAEVARLVDEHLAGRANHRKPLWNLMMFEQWRRREWEIDAPGPEQRASAPLP